MNFRNTILALTSIAMICFLSCTTTKDSRDKSPAPNSNPQLPTPANNTPPSSSGNTSFSPSESGICAEYCGNVPVKSQGNIPDCQACPGAEKDNSEPSNFCANYCSNIPKDAQGYDPQCKACPGATTKVTNSGCESYCKNIPSDSQGNVPDCAKCPGASTESSGGPGSCASYCSSIPLGSRQYTPACRGC